MIWCNCDETVLWRKCQIIVWEREKTMWCWIYDQLWGWRVFLRLQSHIATGKGGQGVRYDWRKSAEYFMKSALKNRDKDVSRDLQTQLCCCFRSLLEIWMLNYKLDLKYKTCMVRQGYVTKNLWKMREGTFSVETWNIHSQWMYLLPIYWINCLFYETPRWYSPDISLSF